MDDYASRIERLGLENAPEFRKQKGDIHLVEAIDAERLADVSVDFTIEKAAWYTQLPIFAGEREPTSAHIEYLAAEMDSGRFNWDLVILATASYKGVQYKINGQHTSWAIIGAKPIKKPPRVREIHYRVESEPQLKAIYASFDRAKPRSDSHLIRIELINTAATQGIPQFICNRINPGFTFWKWPSHDERMRIYAPERAAVINDLHPALYNQVGSFFATVYDSAKNFAVRAPVIAAMFETFDRKPTIAPDFWKDMIEGTNLVKEDARWHLRRFLESSVLSVKSKTRDATRKPVGQEEMYLTCLSAWAKWRKNEQVKILRPLPHRVRAV